jgi:hypothetical protein
LAIDAEGVALGPSLDLVMRVGSSYRAIGLDEARLVLRGFGGDEQDAPLLKGVLHMIVRSLDRGDVVHAQILGLHTPFAALGTTPLRKAGYDPEEPRNPPGDGRLSGEWTKQPDPTGVVSVGPAAETRVALRSDGTLPPPYPSDLSTVPPPPPATTNADPVSSAFKWLYDAFLAKPVSDLRGTDWSSLTWSDILGENGMLGFGPNGGLAWVPGLSGLGRAGAVAKGIAEEAVSEFWALGWAARGWEAEQRLGQNLPRRFPVIDIWNKATGEIASIKSIDIRMAYYQTENGLATTMRGYVDALANFRGAKYAGVEIESADIQARTLIIAIPKAANSAQSDAFAAAARLAASLGIRLKVVII